MTEFEQGYSPKVSSGLLIGGAVAILALPSAVLAISSGSSSFVAQSEDVGAENGGALAPSASLPARIMGRGAADTRLSLAQGNLFRFTPARTETRPDSAITVVVRLDSAAARRAARSGLGASGFGVSKPAATAPGLAIAPTAFELGTARGLSSFSQPLLPAQNGIRQEFPDVRSYLPRSGTTGGSSRFSSQIVMDAKVPSGRAPRTLAGEAQDRVDVSGSYRVTGNLNVTAGVRYSEDHERLRPLTDGKKDNQAIYVGTQFRF